MILLTQFYSVVCVWLFILNSCFIAFGEGYRLADQDNSDWRIIRVYPDGATTFTVYNLQTDTEYEFQVLFRNKSADGMFSPIMKAKTKSPTLAPTPAGPTPGPVRNVTVTKTTLGVRILWHPPADTSVPISHYMIEYKNDTNWLHWGPIKNTTVYEAKLQQGGKYAFRMFAYSSAGIASSSSPEVKLEISGDLQDKIQSKAITVGVVGGILSYIAAIVLSICAVCAVKICNKRKRRKAEKGLTVNVAVNRNPMLTNWDSYKEKMEASSRIFSDIKFIEFYEEWCISK